MNKNILIAGLIGVILRGGGITAYRHFHYGHGAQAQGEIYYCPMHPDYTADRPGDCPICGMHLVKKENSAPAERKIKFYRNPMNPAVTSKVPMKAAFEKIKNGSWQEAADRAKAVVDSSKLKLRQLGIGEEQLASIDKDPGRYDNLLLAADKVWVYAQIYEYESASVKPGQKAAITSRAYPGREFSGTVRSVDPIFSEETRTLRARIETDNPGRELRSEMYVEAAIKADLGTMLAVPVSAVLNTGEKEIAFVLKGENSFEPREVRTGRRNDEYSEIISGLRAGEKVVTSANFMIDSESRMKAALGN